MGWNLPPGCETYHIDAAAGAFDDDPELDPQDEDDCFTGEVCPVCGNWISGVELNEALAIWLAPAIDVAGFDEPDERFVHAYCATDPQIPAEVRAAIERAAIEEAKRDAS